MLDPLDNIDEMLKTAIDNQHILLDLELRKGIPLPFIDNDGQYKLRFPDGHVEIRDINNYMADFN